MRLMEKIALALLLSLTLAVASASGADVEAPWAVFHGDELAYTQNALPDLIVVYAYASNGDLLGVIDPHGNSDAQAMRRVRDAVAGEHFAAPEGRRLGDLAKTLAAYLQDQGYEVGDIVSRRSKYTLLMAMPEVKPTDCLAFHEVETRFEKVIGAAAQSNGASRYALATLVLSSPKSSIKCVSHPGQ